MINCIIIEDQAPAQRILKKYINDFNGLQLIHTFSNAIDAIDYLNHTKVDLIFLDIHLPKISGIDFLSILNHRPFIILTTAFQDYAIKGYELDVVDYLLKPFSFDRFVKAVSKVQRLANIHSQENEKPQLEKEILVKIGYEYIKIGIEQILFIKADNDYSTIYMKDKKHLTSFTLKQWLEKLKEHDFIQVHKSYLIHLKKVESFTKGKILIAQHCIPVGRVFKENFVKRFQL